jgi:hypothetical protein
MILTSTTRSAGAAQRAQVRCAAREGALDAAKSTGATDLFLPDASHMANMEHPRIVNEAIAEIATRCLGHG